MPYMIIVGLSGRPGDDVDVLGHTHGSIISGGTCRSPHPPISSAGVVGENLMDGPCTVERRLDRSRAIPSRAKNWCRTRMRSPRVRLRSQMPSPGGTPRGAAVTASRNTGRWRSISPGGTRPARACAPRRDGGGGRRIFLSAQRASRTGARWSRARPPRAWFDATFLARSPRRRLHEERVGASPGIAAGSACQVPEPASTVVRGISANPSCRKVSRTAGAPSTVGGRPPRARARAGNQVVRPERRRQLLS